MNNKQLNEEILALRAEGLTYRKISRVVGCDHTRINTVLRAAGLAEPQRCFGRNDELAVMQLLKQGLSNLKIADQTSWSATTIRRLRFSHGGVVPENRIVGERRLSLGHREEISRMLVLGFTNPEIAYILGFDRVTIWCEVIKNGGSLLYRAWTAEIRSQQCARRPKKSKLVLCVELRDIVQDKLAQEWSPEQIANWLRYEEYPDNPEMWVSHEAIYQSLYIQGRGALRKELTVCLRTGRAIRKPRGQGKKTGSIPNKIMISERPSEVEDRAIPGHWEGDLIVGEHNGSAIATLVERQTRYVMLCKVTGKTAEAIKDALVKAVGRLPRELFKTLTWDQGTEMADHVAFSMQSKVDVYFCDPHSPWQRGSNENTNGLLRQYFPKGTDLSVYSQEQLDAVSRRLNSRPRKTLLWKTPAQKLDELLR